MFFQLLYAFNAMSFEQSCREMKNIIEETKLKYLKIFNLKSVLELNVFFALIEEESNTVCSKKMEGVGGWRCQDCAKSESTIFCQDCWSKMKDKHKDHNIIFNNQINGTFDCGDHNCIDKQNFCFFPGQNSNKYLIKGQIQSWAKKEDLIIFPSLPSISMQVCFVLHGYFFNNKSQIIKLQAMLISHKVPKQLTNSSTHLINSSDLV